MRRSLVVLALSTALFAAACSKDEAGPAGAPPGGMPPPEVGVVVVQPQDVPLAKELVGQGEATLLATVEQVDPMYVNFSMGVEELAQVRQLAAGGAEGRVEVLLPGGQPYSHYGTLDFSGDVVDPATGAVQLRARIPNPQGVLLPGSFVTVQAVLGTEHNAFLVPQAAVQRDAQGAYVLVVGADGKVARKDIVTERTHGNDWVVREGLAAGDQVIVSGLQRAIPGQPAKASPVPAEGEAPKQPQQGQQPAAAKD